MNKALELEEAVQKIQHNLSNYITELAKMQGISHQEAKKIMDENIQVNKMIFAATKEMMSPEMGGEEPVARKKEEHV